MSDPLVWPRTGAAARAPAQPPAELRDQTGRPAGTLPSRSQVVGGDVWPRWARCAACESLAGLLPYAHSRSRPPANTPPIRTNASGITPAACASGCESPAAPSAWAVRKETLQGSLWAHQCCDCPECRYAASSASSSSGRMSLSASNSLR